MASTANHSLQTAVHKKSLEDPVGFWGQAALDIKWFKFPTKIFSGEGDGASEVRFWVCLVTKDVRGGFELASGIVLC
jgi:hypothetical protein